MGDMYMHHSVTQAGWIFCQIFLQCVFVHSVGREISLQTLVLLVAAAASAWSHDGFVSKHSQNKKVKRCEETQGKFQRKRKSKK